MRPLTRSIGGLSLLLFLVASGSEAQFTQYTTPGGPAGRPVDRKGELAAAVAEARLRLGAVRVAPEISLQDVEYVRNLLGSAGAATPTDFTATVSGGFRAYLPTGPRATWTAYALPEYVWWQKEAGRRRLDGLYGAGLDAFFNRLTLQASAGSDAQQQVLTAEVPRLINARQDHAGGMAELRLTGAVDAFVSGTLIRQRTLGNPAKDPFAALLAELDRDESVVRAGLRWRPGSWLVGLGAEHSDVRFADRRPGAVDRSNQGTAPVLELGREHGRIFFQADIAQRSLTAKQGAAFAKFDKTTGHAAISFAVTPTAEIFVYGSRNLVYSLLADFSYFDDLRHGAALHVKFGRRTRGSLFVETGTLDYTAILPGAPHRKDDLTSYGGLVSFQLLRGAVLGLQGSHTQFTSNLPGAGRTLSTLGLTVTLAAGRPAGALVP